MVILFIIIGLSWSKNYDSVLILYSQSTQNDLISNFDLFPNRFSIETFANHNIVSISLIIDITQDPKYFTLLESLCERFQTFYLSITSKSQALNSKFRLQALPSPESEGQKLAGFINFLNWTSFTIISFSSPEFIQYSTSMKETASVPSLLYILQDNLKIEDLDRVIKRVIKTSGQVNFVIIGAGFQVSVLQQALVLRKANKSNFRFLFPSFALDQVFLEDSFTIGLRDSGSSKSFWESIYLFLVFLIDKFLTLPQSEFLKICPKNDCSNDFDIYKVKNSEKVRVGRIGEELEIEKLDEIRGDKDYRDKSTEILILIANGTSELNQSDVFFQTALYHRGSLFAIEEANLVNSLKGFHYKTQTTDCGNLVYNKDWYIYCFSKLLIKYPVAYLTSLYPNGAYGNALTFKSFGLTVPQISGFANTIELDNTSDFPQYFTLVPKTIDLLVSGIGAVFSRFKWSTAIVFFSSDYAVFVSDMKKYPSYTMMFTILNPTEMQIIPSNYTISDYEQYKSYFEFALNSRCRIFLILTSNPAPVLESLYNIGYRKGDFMAIWTPYMLTKEILQSSDKNFYKVKELLQGTLMASTKEWDGEKGLFLKEKFTALFKIPEYMCLTYDSFGVVHHSIQHLINRGEDFEDPAVLSASLRNQRFSGCMGSVYFNNQSNHWPGVKTLLKQFVLNEKTEDLELLDIISADSFSQTLVTILNTPQWPGSDEHPSNFIDYGDCNFNPRLARESSTGLLVMIIAYALVLINTTFFSVLGWKRFRNLYQEFSYDKMISISDMLFIVCYVFEFFQYISLEPKGGLFGITLKKVNSFLAFSFPYYFDLKFDNFWRFYSLLIGVAASFGILATISIIDTRRSRRIFNSNDQIVDIIRLFMEFMMHTCYLPVISLLLEITQCTNSTGEALSSTYFKYDCLESCYSGRHKTYLIFGISSLFLYSATSSYSKIFLESINPEINLRTSPNYLTILSIFQVLILTVKIVSREYSETISGFLISGLFLLFTIYTYFSKCFNLERVRIMQVSLIFMSFWGLLFSTLFSTQNFQKAFGILCYVGIAVVAILGFSIARKYPKGFLDQRGISIKTLVKFQFSGNANIIFQDSIFKQPKSVNVKLAFIDN